MFQEMAMIYFSLQIKHCSNCYRKITNVCFSFYHLFFIILFNRKKLHIWEVIFFYKYKINMIEVYSIYIENNFIEINDSKTLPANL